MPRSRRSLVSRCERYADGYLTAQSQPAQQGPAARALRHQRAEAVVDLGGQVAEAPAAALATDHSELVRLMSSLQQQLTEVAGAHPLRVPQQRMPSLFGASHGTVSARRPATGDVSQLRRSVREVTAGSSALWWCLFERVEAAGCLEIGTQGVRPVVKSVAFGFGKGML